MAFNWQTFKTRSLTAVVFVVVMMTGLLLNTWSYFILFTLIHFGAWIEYQQLVKKINPEYQKTSLLHRIAVMAGGWCMLLFFTNYELQLGGLALTEIGFWAGLLVMVLLPMIMWIESKLVFFQSIAYSMLGLLYISLPLAFMIELRNHNFNHLPYEGLQLTIPLLIIFSLWINDTMAYIVGSLIGKTQLTPVSPKKTWEGTLGGILLTIITISLLAHFTERISVVHAAVMSAIAAVTGTFGDLFESKLKRMAGVKDSGQLMPGHGGFLDRFDSLLFAAVFAWFYVWIGM